MDYKTLEKVYYTKGNVLKELESRLKNPCTYKTNLFINPIFKGKREVKEKFQLFYLPINEISLLQENIFSNSSEIKSLIQDLPKIARVWCIRNIMMNEIVKTNGIEGVYSTKKEIHNSMNSKKPDRFTGVVKKYQQIIENNIDKIETIEQIRKLYDDIFEEDILKNNENKLDGKYLRKERVTISDGFKNIHTGDSSEEQIIEHLNDLLIFMNTTDVNSLIKATITHYYFEYIHPFYDGNGRFGRLLFSMYLARKLDILTGLSVSYSIFNSKDRYYRLFADASNTKNCGEMTFFVLGVLKIIKAGQKSIVEMLKNKLMKITYIEEYIDSLDLQDKAKKLLYLYMQHSLFFDEFYLEDREISSILKMTRGKLNKLLDSLIEEGFVIKIKSSPSIHTLSEQLKEKL